MKGPGLKIKIKVQEKIKYLKLEAKKEFSIDIKLTVVYDLKIGKRIAYWNPQLKQMGLNMQLLEEFGQEYIDEAVVHEFAHAVISNRYPLGYDRGKKVRAHGKEFKEVCKFFGIEGKATTEKFSNSKHFIERKIKKMKKVMYECSCREVALTMIRHNRVKKERE